MLDQASAWMGLISPDAKIKAEMNVPGHYSRLLAAYDNGRYYSDGYSLVNVGIGIPYVLPPMIGLLVSGSDTLHFIEHK